MARYKPALRTVDRILGLEPANRAARSLRQRIEFTLSSLSETSEQLNIDVHARRRKKRNELIIVVDQDERLLVSLAEILHSHGFKVLSATSFEEAMEVLSSFRPNLMISEVNFANGPAGFDLYLWVRTNATLQDTPFLFLATKVDRQTLIAGKRLGVDDFITKPFDGEVVVASIMNCLARQRKQRKF